MFGKTKEKKTAVSIDIFEETKKCPFFLVQGLLKVGGCIREECKLWNPEEQDCNINVIAKRLAVVMPVMK